MKQKVVIRVPMNGQKSRSKAMKIVVGVSGVESAALQGQENNQIAVVGENIDPVVLATLLRKNVGSADLVSVSAVGGEEKKETTENKNAATAQPPVWFHSYYPAAVPQYPICHADQPAPFCDFTSWVLIRSGCIESSFVDSPSTMSMPEAEARYYCYFWEFIACYLVLLGVVEVRSKLQHGPLHGLYMGHP
ncbi:unnamed protein product [Ilex paraguariensis]|uniref:HMA domain-containing protein n=1 Tax=Ilex paraguariensis TaxID=185542 RepID=A0ABC8SY48_9AQUA